MTRDMLCLVVSSSLALDRLLKEGGVLINITYGEPAARVPLLERLQFDVSFYVLSKTQELAAGAAVLGAPVGTRGGVTLHGPISVHEQVSCWSWPQTPTEPCDNGSRR